MITDNEILNLIVTKVLVTNDNIDDIIKNFNSKYLYYFTEELTNDNLKKIFEKTNGKLISIESSRKDIVFSTNEKYEIVYIYKEDEKKIYRRTKLKEYLNKRYKVLNIPVPSGENSYVVDDALQAISAQISNNALFIFCCEEGSSGFVREAVNLLRLNKSKILYDKYDNFKDDIMLQYYSNVLTVTSKVIADNIAIKNKETFYAPNGCTAKKYIPIDKYEKKTAVYCGANIKKIDFDSLNLLKALNENWDIEVIGIPEEELDNYKEENPDLIIKSWMDENSLHEELCKCHLGLCLTQPNDMTSGQLSDKFFNYINAHIPMVANEEIFDNYIDYTDFVSCLDFDKLELDNYLKEIPDEKYEELLKECDWDARFDKLINIAKEEKLL